MSSLRVRRSRLEGRALALNGRWEQLAAAVLALMALGFAWNAGVKSLDPVPDVLRVVAGAGVLATACGYAPARVLLPHSMRAHFPLFVPLIGAPTAAFGLTVLGFLHVPIQLSLGLLVVLGGAAALGLRVKEGPVRADPARLAEAGSIRWRLVWPVYIVALAAAVSLLPLLQTGFATTTGQNGDAVLAAGTGEFLQKTPPRGQNVDLYVDKMPANWRSKYPIYYTLAGVSELSGLPPTQVLSTVMSLMLAMVGMAFFLLAFYTLGAGPVGALVAAGLVAFSRSVLYLGVQPFHNQIWGVFALPLTILFGFYFLRRPSRGSAVLLGLFLALAAFAYPLMLPFPALLLAVAGWVTWRERRSEGTRPGWIRALDLPHLRAGRIVAVVLAVAATPFLIFGLIGAAEKIWAAAQVVVPGSNLLPWNALPNYIPFHRFMGLVDPGSLGLSWILIVAMLAAAGYACTRLPRATGLSVGITIVAALLVGVYFRIRAHGGFFYFKDLSFLGPLLTAVTATGLMAALRQRSVPFRAAGAVTLALVVVATGAGARLEAVNAGNQLTPALLEVRQWSRALPPGATVLIDLPRGGNQLWSDYMLADRPVSATRPYVSSTFPSPNYGARADYLLVYARKRVAPELVPGGQVHRNRVFALYRMGAYPLGPDTSSKRLQETFGSPLK